jgi:Aspartyl/Asparaginyl beta-hydroxylase
MLDLPGLVALDKQTLVGGCVRLPLRVDAARLKAEVAALPSELWGSRGGRVGVHNAAQAIFLRGYAPAEGDKPIEDRTPLGLLPYVQQIINVVVPAVPLRCLIARLPAGTVVRSHVDRAPYFAKSLRLHVPVDTHDAAWMTCASRCYRMAEGEVWVLNNNATHAVWNAHAIASRTHIICDFVPSPDLLALLAAGERELGEIRPDVDRHIAATSPALASAGG